MQKYIQAGMSLDTGILIFQHKFFNFCSLFFTLHCGPAFGNQLLLTGSDNILIWGIHVSSVAINSALISDDQYLKSSNAQLLTLQIAYRKKILMRS